MTPVEFLEFRYKTNINLMDYDFKQAKAMENNWKLVYDETPPIGIELLAKSPTGSIHLTSWRPAYDIFCCQEKRSSSEDWYWKLI